MKCYNLRPHLEKMAAGEIDGMLLRQLEEHFQTCSGCHREYQEMRQALELWRQESQIGPAPQFNPAWRQRIRQDAFKKEADSCPFYRVFKANTLIPALGVLAVLAVLGMFNLINNRFTLNVTIEPQKTSYSPEMSATVGIPLIVKLEDGRLPKDVIYYWTAEYGKFFGWDGNLTELGAEVKTQADKVYWSIDPKDKGESSSWKIYLQVEDQTGETLARDELSLERDWEGVWVVKGP